MSEDSYYLHGYRSAIERALEAVDEEAELEGVMPDALRNVPLEDALRAVVRATKKSIRDRIEQLKMD